MKKRRDNSTKKGGYNKRKSKTLELTFQVLIYLTKLSFKLGINYLILPFNGMVSR